jgi:integrase/recombinase XerD
MLTNYIKAPHAVKRMRANYFHYIFDDYVSHLHLHGYAPGTIQCYCQAVEHFGYWLEKNHIPRNFVEQTRLHDFIRHLIDCQCSLPRIKSIKTIRAAINQLFKIIPPAIQAIPLTSVEYDRSKIIQDFDAYLINVCGVAKNTIIYRKRYSLAFLHYVRLQELSQIEQIRPQQIISFIKQFSSYYASGSIGVVSTSLRSFLKYTALLGYKVKHLLGSVPNIPNWRLSQVPECLTSLEITKLLNIFNQQEASGQRNYAMTCCFTDLGLRCCEVASIKIKDINWHTGILNICRSKTNQTDQLPLTKSLGEAISNYLLNGRPSSKSEYIFVHHRAPLGEAVRTETVRAVIRYSFKKAGFNPVPSPHILRRSFATQLLNAGSSLKDIADILGHKSIDTTMIYTKADLLHLSLVAMPWFGGSHE